MARVMTRQDDLAATSSRDPRWPAALAGALAAGVAIAVGELAAGLLGGAPSLVTAMGTMVISLQPPGAKDLVVALFGTNDKLALNVAVLVVALAIAAGAGVLASRRLAYGAAVFITFGVVGTLAALREPLVEPILAVIVGAIATVAGLLALRWLLSLAPSAIRPSRRAGSVTGAGEPFPDTPEWSRRQFLIASAGTLGGVVVAGGLGRTFIEADHDAGIVTSSKLPRVASAVAPLAADQSFAVSGITPIVVPNNGFYRIDTALLVPRVDVKTWKLEVKGMVDHPLTYTYDDLLAMPLFEQYVTIGCVSDPVGGPLIGNALWTGVHLKELLASAGVQAGATQIIGRSVDGFTAGFPTSWATDPDREPMVAVGMNREPLPAGHGFPARLIVPGLYGYVSATKWLASIELTTREAVDGYWVPLGWAKDAPMLTQSRIDVPRSGANVTAGPVQVAGVAWAPDRGIAGVEVSVDDGEWQTAAISRPISDATWVQWQLPWTATQGRHTLEVRATDNRGEIQTDQHTRPDPDGARGHHRISVVVG